MFLVIVMANTNIESGMEGLILSLVGEDDEGLTFDIEAYQHNPNDLSLVVIGLLLQKDQLGLTL